MNELRVVLGGPSQLEVALGRVGGPQRAVLAVGADHITGGRQVQDRSPVVEQREEPGTDRAATPVVRLCSLP